MNKKIKIALLGIGKIGERHLNLLNSKSLKNKFEIIAVCEKSKKKISIIKKKFNKVKIYSDFKEMLKKNPSIDIVSICSASGYHYEHAKISYNFKKNIIVEKPLALNFKDAAFLTKKFKKIQKKIFVVMQNRFNPPIVALKQFLKKNKLGKISSALVLVWWCRDQNYYNQNSWRGTWKLDGGVLSNQAIHHLDMLLYLLGDVKSVMGQIKRKFVKIESEDYGSALIQLKSGASAVIQASNATRPRNLEGSITIHGEKGSIKIGGTTMNNIEFWIDNKKGENNKKILKKFNNQKKSINGHKKFYDHVYDAFNNNTKYIDGKEGIRSIELVNAIYYSALKGKKIFLPLKNSINKFDKKIENEIKS